ncbi:MAG: alpha-mannosidase, partial [Bacteroides thetaiotaomicron]|nr:alpha-mannosidase [Bacteroides thetaiotaomicron]
MMNKKVIAVALALALAGGSYAQDDTAKKKVKAYMVSDAHLDTQWNWDIQTTINEYVWNTISQNLFLLKKYPEYVFNFEGGVKYAWMKEYYPEQYEEMKKFIEEGRWHIAGSSWEASDVLVPSVEASIRNIMLGQTYYRQEFGKEGTDIFLPDCFGFGWTLPTIAAHCGLIGFSSQKLDWRNHPFYGKSKHPFTIGLWKGIDGKQVMLAHGYDYGRKWNNEDLSKNKDLEKLAQRTPLNTVYRYYGTGDIGGSPTLGSVRSVEQGIKGDGPVEVISATSDQLFKDYLPFNNHPELPVFDGELLMDVHGTGCYTSQAAMKLYNRQNEQLGDAAERAAVAAEWLGTASYPQHTLTEAWKRFIFHQFHDDLTGTSIPRAYEFSWNDELISLKQFSQVLTSSVNAIAGQMDTRVKGTPVVLYNANAFPVSDLTEIILEQPKTPKGFTVYNAQGKKVASQMIGYENGRAHILVAASLPANSYAVYDVRTGGSEKTISPSAASAIENSVYKITLDKNGDIISLTDKRNNKELVKDGKAIRLALFTENKSYAWPAWEILKETIDREPVSITDGAKITLVENGALRKALCIEKKYGKSLFKQYIRLYEGSRADRIDFYNEIDWQSTNTLLKAEFPLNIENEKATYDLGIGSVERGNNVQTAYEVYAQQWADLTDKNNSYGVSILNDSKYGWDKPDNNTIRLTLLHTPETKGNYAYQDHQDFGFHTFTYSLTGHNGALDKPATVIKAEILNQPIKAFSSPKHAGTLGKEFAFVRSSNDQVVIKALKKAEVSDEYVVRVYETGGAAPQQAAITFAGEIEKAVLADGTEKEIGSADFNKNQLNVSIAPY